MTRSPRPAVNPSARLRASALALSFVLHSVASHAAPGSTKESTKAEQLFDEGTRLLDEKRYPEALLKLKESQRLGPGIGVAMYLADCYDGLGQTAKALALFREAEQLARAKKDGREAIAHERAEEVLGRVPSITIQLPPAAEGDVLIKVDDEAIDRQRLARPILLDPGQHVVSASAGGYSWTMPVELPSRGAATFVTVPSLHPVAAASVAGIERRPLHVAGIASLTGGGILVGVGVLFGLNAIHKEDASLENGHCDADARCDGRGLELRREGLDAAAVSTALITVGLVAAATGAVLYFLDARAARPASRASFPARGFVW